MPVVGRVGVGAMANYLTLHGRAPFVFASIEADPSVEHRAFRLRLPIGVRHRQAFVTPWTETAGHGSFELRYRPVRRFRAELSGGAIARLRPAWLDLYQPISPGNLSHTHRYSRWSRFLALELAGMPIQHEHLRLSYRYSYMKYWQDPHYQPLYYPTHLVPYDHTEHLIEASWHHLKDKLRIGGTMVARHRNYYFAFARDAGTGLTHASVYSANPNPLYRVWYLRPSIDSRIDLSEAFRARLEYGHEIQIDSYQGYFSYQGPNPSAGIEWSPDRKWNVEASSSLQWRRYGPGSFQAGPTHPPLEDGNRRYAHRWAMHVGASYAVRRHVALYVDCDYARRSSNRPDYVPGIYPATRQYAIDFDYVNFRAIAGLRMSN